MYDVRLKPDENIVGPEALGDDPDHHVPDDKRNQKKKIRGCGKRAPAHAVANEDSVTDHEEHLEQADRRDGHGEHHERAHSRDYHERHHDHEQSDWRDGHEGHHGKRKNHKKGRRKAALPSNAVMKNVMDNQRILKPSIGPDQYSDEANSEATDPEIGVDTPDVAFAAMIRRRAA